MEQATNLVKDMNRNPTGKGGFGDRPQDISPGGWKKENVFSYQFKRFMNMSETEFREFAKTPKDTMTMAERLAYTRVLHADKSLADFKEIADRTEGKAAQAVDVTTNGKDLPSPIMTISRDE
jgi:hypothetical protein